jgi:hypothetical protein
MPSYLLIWGACVLTLLISVGALYWIYRILGSDFGLNDWKREVLTALVAAALQAGVFAVALYLTSEGAGAGGARRFALLFSFAMLWVCYKLTHLTEMDNLEISILAAVQHLLLIAIAFARGTTATGTPLAA